MQYVKTESLLQGASAIGPGAFKPGINSKKTLQASVVGTGAVSATVVIEVSNTGVHFLTLATLTLSGTGSATDGIVSDAPWAFVRANVTALSDGAVVNASMGG